MTVVRIPPTLRAETGGERQVEAEGSTVRDVLENLTARFPALRDRLWENGDVAPFVNVYVEGEDVRTRDGIDTPVAAGQTVILLPAMAGGATARLAGVPVRPAEPAFGHASRRWRQDAARSPLARTGRTVLRGSRWPPLPAPRQAPGG